MEPHWLPTTQGQCTPFLACQDPCSLFLRFLWLPLTPVALGRLTACHSSYQATSPHHWAPAGMPPRPGCTLE